MERHWSIFRIANLSKKISLDLQEIVQANWLWHVNWNKHTKQCKMLGLIMAVAGYTFSSFG